MCVIWELDNVMRRLEQEEARNWLTSNLFPNHRVYHNHPSTEVIQQIDTSSNSLSFLPPTTKAFDSETIDKATETTLGTATAV